MLHSILAIYCFELTSLNAPLMVYGTTLLLVQKFFAIAGSAAICVSASYVMPRQTSPFSGAYLL
jgi:hypothetical protein